jgi:hypothetical protein
VIKSSDNDGYTCMVNGDARTVDFGCASSVFFARNHG